jgi:hypothetical protein
MVALFLFLKGMTGALAPLSCLVFPELTTRQGSQNFELFNEISVGEAKLSSLQLVFNVKKCASLVMFIKIKFK